MTVAETAEKFGLKVLAGEAGLSNVIEDVYICDLLSWVMGRAAENCAFITIKGNINSIGVASLIGASCVIIAEDAPVDDNSLKKADEEDIPVLKSTLNSYGLAKLFAEAGI